MEGSAFMKSTPLFPLLCLLAAVAPATAALAAGPAALPTAGQPQVVLSVDVKEEISAPDAQGDIRIVRRDVDRADPGDVLVYTLTYTNLGSTPAANARVDDPIPAGTLLLPSSVEGGKARVTFSADGGKSFAAGPLTRTIDGPDGKPVTVELPAEKYTHIRWTAPDTLAAGESRTASFKVIVR